VARQESWELLLCYCASRERPEYVTCATVCRECLRRWQLAFIGPPAAVHLYKLPYLLHLRGGLTVNTHHLSVSESNRDAARKHGVHVQEARSIDTATSISCPSRSSFSIYFFWLAISFCACAMWRLACAKWSRLRFASVTATSPCALLLAGWIWYRAEPDIRPVILHKRVAETKKSPGGPGLKDFQ
jgi:hypothetical protein